MRDLTDFMHLVRSQVPDRSLRGILRSFPATIALTTIITTTSLATRNLSHAEYEPLLARIGMSYADVWSRDAWHMFTVTFIQSNPGIGVGMLALLLSGLALAELQIGTWRTVVTFFTCDWICTVVTATLLRAMQPLDVARITEAFTEHDAGSSAAGLATLSAALVLLFPNRLAKVALVIVLAWNVASLGFLDFGPALVHSVAVVVGAVFAQLVWKRTHRTVIPAVSPALTMRPLTDAHA
ncbi:MAG: hypothetical protein ACTHMX_04375 [Thermomicrobiales bacterium]